MTVLMTKPSRALFMNWDITIRRIYDFRIISANSRFPALHPVRFHLNRSIIEPIKPIKQLLTPLVQNIFIAKALSQSFTGNIINLRIEVGPGVVSIIID